MTTSVIGLSNDCADPVALAGFWSEVLARPVAQVAPDLGELAVRPAMRQVNPGRGQRVIQAC